MLSLRSIRTARPFLRRAATGALLLAAAGLGQTAWAQTPTTCYAATTIGTDGPVDFGAYCWIDFTPLNLAQATSGTGQDFQVNLPGGAYLTFTLKITGNTAGLNIAANPVPSWSGAAFGNSAFNNISGAPVLYQTTQPTPTTTITFTNLILNANGTTDLPFVFVAADGESTNNGESLSFTTTGDTWDLVDAPGISNPNRNMPVLNPATTVGNNTGSQTVTETGTAGGSAGEGSYVFTTNNSPGTVTAVLNGGGLQGVLFGLKYHTVGLSLTKTHTGNFKVGGTGSYTISVTNTVTAPLINPPTDPQPVEVKDTLPTGLTYASASGTGWSCSASGQVVTCDTTSSQDLTTTKTFPSITINVNVASNAPATLTNSATVSDTTSSTLVFNVCETAGNGVCPSSATSTAGDPTTILHPDLSTSTKTVVDTNGGDAEPGDTLEYTITLTESAGVAATGVSVTDDIPNKVSGFTVVSTPSGSTDSSTGTGTGANNTGYLNVTGITVPASGNVTIVYDVTVAAGDNPGDTIANTATITNPNGATTTTTVTSDTVTVEQSQIPASGNKILYVYTSNDQLTRTPQTGTGGGVLINQNATHDWTLNPALQKPLTIVAGSTISVTMQVECTQVTGGGACKNGTSLFWTGALYDNTVSTGTQIGFTSVNATFNDTAYTQVTANILFCGVGGSLNGAGTACQIPLGTNYTIAAAHKLILEIKNTSTSNRPMSIEQYNGGNLSTVALSVSTVINVDSVGVFTDATCATALVNPIYETTSNVYICAVVSDPFGSYDIDPATGGTAPTLTIKDTNSTTQLAATAMTQVADSGAATKTFEYTYTVPTAPPATLVVGFWTPSVTATEGTTTDVAITGKTITHTANGSFDVEMPNLLVMKAVSVVTDPVHCTTPGNTGSCTGTATTFKSIPGSVMQYLVNVSNQGKGPADSNTLAITDPVPTDTSFMVGSPAFSDGSPSSGLSAPTFSYDNSSCTGSFTYAPTGTFDPNVRCIKATFSGSMNGKTGTAPAFNITFKVQIN